MSARLDKDLSEKYGVRSMPVVRDDEVKIVSGTHKGREGRITSVYRKRYVIHVERLTRQARHARDEVPIPVHPSNVVITKLKSGASRDRILDRRGKSASGMDRVD